MPPIRLLAALIIALACAPAEAQHSAHGGHDTASGQDHSAHGHAHHLHARRTTVPPEARAQWRQLTDAMQRYRDFAVAEREGWKRFGGDGPLMGEHWYDPAAREPLPGEPLDFSRPSNLQYAWVDGRRELVGVSYVVRLGEGDPLPEGFAGDADHWHVHDALKFIAAATEERPLLRWLANGWVDAAYRRKGDERSRLAMVHAWVTVPSPDGPFSMHNRALPYLRAGLPLASAAHGDEDAANGVNLATEHGCREALDGVLWIADARRAQARALRDRCAEAARAVRAAIARDPRDASAINAAARDAWRDLEASKRRTLDPKQHARLAAVTEHDPMH